MAPLRANLGEHFMYVKGTYTSLWPSQLGNTVGNCPDPAEQKAREQLEVWLSRWERGPDCPRERLLVLPSYTTKNPEDRSLVTPVF